MMNATQIMRAAMHEATDAGEMYGRECEAEVQTEAITRMCGMYGLTVNEFWGRIKRNEAKPVKMRRDSQGVLREMRYER